jgi:PEP-CTERM motif
MPAPHGSRRSTRSRRRSQRRRFLAGTALFLLTLATALLYERHCRSANISTAPAKAAVDAPEVAAVADAAADRGRSIYPYSIIQGGAASVSELRKAIDTDPVVRAHFQHFDLANTRVERLTSPRLAHVSYRVGSAVYWTKRPVVLKTGEKVLTDGKNVARTRCANQLAAVPPADVSPLEPEPAVLDTPIARIPTRTTFALGLVAESDPPAAPGPFSHTTGGAGVPPPAASYTSPGPGPAGANPNPSLEGDSNGHIDDPGLPPTTPLEPTPIPEPATVGLLALGAGAVALRRRRRL